MKWRWAGESNPSGDRSRSPHGVSKAPAVPNGGPAHRAFLLPTPQPQKQAPKEPAERSWTFVEVFQNRPFRLDGEGPRGVN